MRFLLLLLLLATACQRYNKQVSIHPELFPYVQEFTANAAAHGRPIVLDNIIVRFGTLQYPTVGECYQKYTPEVTIDTNFWFDEAVGSEREILMHHELGHCLLRQNGHRDDWIVMNGNWIEESIMNTYLIDYWNYDLFKQYYLQELFAY